MAPTKPSSSHDNGEDIVVVLLRQVEILLAAAAEAQAQQAAGADGILRLQHLQALVERVVLRVAAMR